MQAQSPKAATARPASGLVWTLFLLLCAIAAAAVLRRVFALVSPSTSGVSPTAGMDAVFAARRNLTLAHILPALAFIALLPAWFAQRVRARAGIHRAITLALFALGAVVGITALAMNTRPVGGAIESSAVLVYDSLFLFFLARSWMAFRKNESREHRIWMTRAVAVLLGIATTRPVMGVFFATARLTHLRPEQFFGIAFWIGFTATFAAGEIYVRRRIMPQGPSGFSHPRARKKAQG